MTTTSTLKPGLGDNWSSFGAIVFVSVLGPALILLFSTAPIVVVELVPRLLDFGLCIYMDSCEFGGGDWSTWLLVEHRLLYAFWVTPAAGFACFATLESTFHIFRRAAPIPVLIWLVMVVLILMTWIPVDWMRLLISVGWAGTSLVLVHYYFSYSELPLYLPPEGAVGDDQKVPAVTRESIGSTEIPSGLDSRQLRALIFLAIYTAALFGLAAHAFMNNQEITFMTCIGFGLYVGPLLLHQVMFSRNAPALTIDRAGLTHHGQEIPWREIGRVWIGAGQCRHVVVIESSEASARRLLQATTWINRLFAKANVARGRLAAAAHFVVIDMRFLLGEASELVQAIEAHRPPGSRWIPPPEVS